MSKKRFKASTTIELAYMMPIVLLAFTSIIYLAFYFHDKSILYSTLMEGTIIQKQQLHVQEPIKEADLEKHIKYQLSNKLLFFKLSSLNIVVTSEQINIEAIIEKHNLKIKEKNQRLLKRPEDNIRNINRIGDVASEINHKD